MPIFIGRGAPFRLRTDKTSSTPGPRPVLLFPTTFSIASDIWRQRCWTFSPWLRSSTDRRAANPTGFTLPGRDSLAGSNVRTTTRKFFSSLIGVERRVDNELDVAVIHYSEAFRPLRAEPLPRAAGRAFRVGNRLAIRHLMTSAARGANEEIGQLGGGGRRWKRRNSTLKPSSINTSMQQELFGSYRRVHSAGIAAPPSTPQQRRTRKHVGST